MSKRSLYVLGGISTVFILLGLSIYLFRPGVPMNPDYPAGTASAEVFVDVPIGASGSDIAKLLVVKKVVESFGSFFGIAVGDIRSSSIAPGIHRIHTHIPASQALEELLDPARMPNLIKVAEGAWTNEIVTQLIEKGFKKTAVDEAFKNLVRPVGITGNEGILFPAHYSFGSVVTAAEALQSMVDRFTSEVTASGLLAGTSNFSPIQLLTIASLIQAEGDVEDFGKISQVIRNRIKIGMPLQFDSTINYITHTRGQIFLSTTATKTISPYNTYLHYGLPPGPIGNPGRAAMDAALHPEAGDWLFFITVAPGDTRFTKSHNKFLTWKSEYEKNLKDGAFGNRP
ncbi:MAG: endolytic transglycosylase MltG [Candidatus Nanopelagicaceae bacterium]|nr:endolytic transglycosylase MltG [Candidatus Nanopelagicaceae bacterium]